MDGSSPAAHGVVPGSETPQSSPSLARAGAHGGASFGKSKQQRRPAFFGPEWELAVAHLREQIYWTLEADGEPIAADVKVSKRLKLFLRVVITVLIVVAVACFVAETMPTFADVPEEFWKTLEAITTSVFTAEYLLRLSVCDLLGTSMVHWALRPLNLCDLFSVLPWYAELVLTSSNMKWLRVLRVVRLCKLGRYSQGVKIMTMALFNSLPALNILAFLFLIGITISASTVYFTEKFSCPEFASDGDGDHSLAGFRAYNRECDTNDGTSPTYGTCCAYECRGLDQDAFSLCRYSWLDPPAIVVGRRLQADSAWEANPMHAFGFTNVVTCMWWACVTMTTVGYGDMVPAHWLSKLISSGVMLSGMLIIAMPFAIVGTKFSEAVAHVKKFTRAQTAPTSPLGFNEKKQQEYLTRLQSELQDSAALKQQILEVQMLRDNLWTSVEHAFATLACEGIQCLGKELLEPEVSEKSPFTPEQLAALGESGFATPSLRPLGMEKEQQDCEWSCWLFHRHSWFRRMAIRLTKWTVFDRLVLLAIIANSIILALQDYYTGLYPGRQEPLGNKLQTITEIPFIVFFTIECAAKIVAYGFILGDKSYLRDAWNWIDFIVVVTGLYSLAPSMKTDLSILRTFRVLRPLRTLSALPGMRKLVNTIVASLPGLKDVICMFAFLLVTFGILGLHFWGGVMFRRCRMTSQPLHFTQRALDADCNGWCFDDHSLVTVDTSGSSPVTVNSTLVFEAFCATVPACMRAYTANQDYYAWPIDHNQERLCGGAYSCMKVGPEDAAFWDFGKVPNSQLLDEVIAHLGVVEERDGEQMVTTTCGSSIDDDPVYSPGSVNAELVGMNMNDHHDEIFSENFNWGMTNFNWVGASCVVVFQCLTLEGWVDIMYMLQDSASLLLGFLYFWVLIIICSFFLLNVFLAIVMEAFLNMKDKDENMVAMRLEMLREQEQVLGLQMEKRERAGKLTITGAVEAMFPMRQLRAKMQTRTFSKLGPAGITFGRFVRALLTDRDARDLGAILLESHDYFIVRVARRVANNIFFNGFIMFIILMNVLCLTMDSYPETLWDRRVLSGLSLAFNIIFIVEFVILQVALGPLAYWGDNAAAFDGLIVALTVVELIISSASGSEAGSAFTALRAFRLLRIFKLAKRFRSMKILLKSAAATLLSMRDFLLLLFLIIAVFALIGQSFFGGKFMFDENDGRVIPEGELQEKCPFGPGGKPTCLPRAHFDTFLWSSITVFQILSGENWNAVMYDSMKATGWYALFYFVAVIFCGTFVILNLFLAILMMNFQSKADEERRRQDELKSQKTQSEKNIDIKSAKKEADEEVEISRLDSKKNNSENQASKKKNSKEHSGRAATSTYEMDATPTSKSNISQISVGNTYDVATQPLRPEEAGCASPKRLDWVVAENPTPATKNDLKVESFNNTPVGSTESSSQDQQAKQEALKDALAHADHTPQLQQDHLLPSMVADTDSNSLEMLEAQDKLEAHPASPVERRVSNSSTASPRKEESHGRRISRVLAQGPALVGMHFAEAVHELTMMLRQDSKDLADEKEMSYSRGPGRWLIMQEKIFRRCPSLRTGCCFILTEAHPLRSVCLSFAQNPRFDQVILVSIGISSLLMSLSNPLNDPDSWLEITLKYANFVFTTIFTLEMSIKMTAFGIFCGRDHGKKPAYLQNAWNVMDGLIVTTSVVDMAQSLTGSDSSISWLKIFRVARMLRPLRLIARNRNMRVVIQTIGSALPELRNLVVFSSIFYLIFGLLFVSSFKGSFYRCQIPDDHHVLEDAPWNYGEEAHVVTPLRIPWTSEPPYFKNATKAEPDDDPNIFEAWSRPDYDTPICEVHCEASTHPYCSDDPVPWGYHVMRCTDCRDTFRDYLREDPPSRSTCESRCDDHEYFCADKDTVNRAGCLEQCVASCMGGDACVGLVADAALCVEQGGRWVNLGMNFDNILNAIVALFEICTTEGWLDLMLASTDGRGPYLQPQRDKNELFVVAAFFLFMMIGSFFVLNLCIGVIIDNYNRQKEKKSSLLKTAAQTRWVEWQRALYHRRQFFLQLHTNELSPTRQHLSLIVSTTTFEQIIMTCIVLNTGALAMPVFPSISETYAEATQLMNTVFGVVFNIEAIMKLCAMKLNYFNESWNCFDFLLVAVSDAFWVFEAVHGGATSGNAMGTVINAIRIFRIARLFRLVRFLKGLNRLFFALVLSIPKLVNVGAIMVLLIYLYSVLGMALFAKVEYLPGGTYNEHSDFRSFFKAFTLLIRCMTGEAWNYIMHDLSKDKFYYESYVGIKCDETLTVTSENFRALDLRDGVEDGYIGAPTECGYWGFAYPFFISYTLIVTFVILNLFIAVIFEGFEESQKSEVADLIATCIDVWKKYDPDTTMQINVEKAMDFVDEVVMHTCRFTGKDLAPDFTMEKRWDSHLPVDMNANLAGGNMYAYFNLRYMRMMGLRVTPTNEVRFVVAVRAVMRRIICQGGLNETRVTPRNRLRALRELEALDKLLLEDCGERGADVGANPAPKPVAIEGMLDFECKHCNNTGLELGQQPCSRCIYGRREMQKQEMKELKIKELRQARSIAKRSGGFRTLKRAWSITSSLATRARISTRAIAEGEERFDRSLLEEVAAAKLQMYFKEAMERRQEKRRQAAMKAAGTLQDAVKREGSSSNRSTVH